MRGSFGTLGFPAPTVIALGDVNTGPRPVVGPYEPDPNAPPTPIRSAPEPLLSESMRNNIKILGIVAVIGTVIAVALGARSWNNRAALYAGLATIPGGAAAALLTVAAAKVFDPNMSSDRGWTWLVVAVLATLGGAGIAGGVTYARLSKRK